MTLIFFLSGSQRTHLYFQNFLVEGSAMWRTLPDQEKENFRQKAKKERETYEAQLLKWEAK